MNYRTAAKVEPDAELLVVYPMGMRTCPYCNEDRYNPARAYFNYRIVGRFDAAAGMVKERCRDCRAVWHVQPRAAE